MHRSLLCCKMDLFTATQRFILWGFVSRGGLGIFFASPSLRGLSRGVRIFLCVISHTTSKHASREHFYMGRARATSRRGTRTICTQHTQSRFFHSHKSNRTFDRKDLSASRKKAQGFIVLLLHRAAQLALIFSGKSMREANPEFLKCEHRDKSCKPP